MGRTFSEDRLIEGEPLDETCPECGSDVVRLADYTPLGSGTSYLVRCTNRGCGWREKRTEKD